MRKILYISLWSTILIGLVVTLGFVDKEQDNIECKSLDININQDDESFFVDQDEIKQIIHDRGDKIIYQPLSSINIKELESVLNSHASIANAEVYVSVNGEVKVDITQRKPIIRIVNNNNESYYIDNSGRLMPLSDKYTSKILVANGNFFEPFARRYKYTVEDILKNEYAKNKSIIDDLYILATYIDSVTFWKAQIQQVYVNDDKEFELIPRVGNHKIILGDISDLNEKFTRLLIFYKEGLNRTNNWNSYSAINLKFKNQIVCTKKE